MLKRRLIVFVITVVLGFGVFYFGRSCFSPKPIIGVPPKAAYAVTFKGRAYYSDMLVLNDSVITLAKPWTTAKGEWVPGGPRSIILSLGVSDNITIKRLK